MSKLKKPILHFKIPRFEKSGVRDNLAISPEIVTIFVKIIKKELKNKAYVIFSPLDLDVYGVDSATINLDEITLKEFLDKYDIKKDGE